MKNDTKMTQDTKDDSKGIYTPKPKPNIVLNVEDKRIRPSGAHLTRLKTNLGTNHAQSMPQQNKNDSRLGSHI